MRDIQAGFKDADQQPHSDDLAFGLDEGVGEGQDPPAETDEAEPACLADAFADGGGDGLKGDEL